MKTIVQKKSEDQNLFFSEHQSVPYLICINVKQ